MKLIFLPGLDLKMGSSYSKVLLFFIVALVSFKGIKAQTINAKQKDVIIIDNGISGKADAADRIRYDVTIENTGGAPGNNTQLNIVPDPRTTFVPGTFRSSPLALDDAYACTGNVGLDVPAANGVKANDYDDNIAGATVTAGTFATTGGGSITIAADGSFMYIPPAGQSSGTDTYTYALNDGNGVGGGVPNTNSAVITFTISNLIYFIDNSSVAATSDGRLTSPFKNLVDFQAGSGAPANVVYLEETGTNYSGTLALAANEKLFGTGHNGGANLADVLGFSVATFSKTLPAINGTRPVIVNPSGGGLVLNSGNTVRGLNVGNCNGFAIDDNGSSVGSLTISQVAINNGTAGGYRNANGGTLAVTLDNVTASSSISGIMINNTSGSFAVTGATNITNSTGTGLSLNNNSTNFSFNTITVGGTLSDGIYINAQTGTFTASGLTTVNALAVGTGFSINIGTGTGTITFANIDINGRRSSGININGGSRAITTGTVDIDNSNNSVDAALSISGTTGGNNISFGTTTINNNGASGNCIFINGAAQPVTFGAGSAISNSSGVEFNVNAGSGNITYNGSVTNTSGGAVAITGRTGGTIDLQGTITHNAAAVGISVANNTSGTELFSGATKTLNSSTANAVNLTTNGTSTINFTNGGLAITTTSGVGFNATGGATAINVSGSNNTISSGTGVALNVVSTTIGASNLNFKSISSNGSANGINLNATGPTGGLTVTGDSGGSNNGSGGTIQNTTGVGILIDNSTNASFGYMNITNCGTDCARINNINGLTFNRCNISDNSGVAQDRGIEIGDFSTGTAVNGTINITNTVISQSPHDNLSVGIASGTSTWNITNSTFNNSGNTGFNLEYRNASNPTLTFTGCTFNGVNGNTAEGIHMQPAGAGTNGTLIANILNNSFADNNIAIDLNCDISATTTYKVTGNTIINTNRRGVAGSGNTSSHAINIFQATTSLSGALLNLRCENNIIGSTSFPGSGSSIGNGMRINFNGNGQGRILLNNNTIRECPIGRGIEITGRNGTGQLDATLTNNNVIHYNLNFDITNGSNFPLGAIVMLSNTVSTPGYTVRSDVRTNTVPSAGGALPASSEITGTYLSVQELPPAGGSIHQLVDNAPASATPTAELQSQNTGDSGANAGVSLIAGPINLPPP